MKDNAIFLENLNDFQNLSINNINLNDFDIFTFDVEVHKHLIEKKIFHYVADTFINKIDHEKIFKYTSSLYEWHKNKLIPPFEFEGINILSLFDTSEFHNLLVREIHYFIIIKRILEKFQFSNFTINSHLSLIIKLILKHNTKIIIIKNSKSDFSVRFEKYSLPISIFGKNLPIQISRKKYEVLKNIFESILGNIFGLFYKSNNKTSPIILVELNTEQYGELFYNLKKYHQDIILINLRKPAFWNLKTLNSLKKSNCKILTPNSFLSKNEISKISSISLEYSQKLDELWKNPSSFSQIFLVENISIWSLIEKILLRTFKERINEYIKLIIFSKKIQMEINSKCMLSVNIFGETEKVMLQCNPNVPSILLEHAFTNYVPELQLYDISNMYPIFKDKISLWGNIQKNYLTKQHNIPDERIILSGSPRHDIFFHTTSEKTSSSKLKILITLGILDEQNAIFDTELFLRFESTLEKIFLTLKNLDNISFIVKLHPSSQKNNMYMKKFIHKFDEKIIIHQFTSILDEIQDCDIMINIFTEIYGSTVMLEGLILEKPILNISLDTRLYEFEFEKNNAVLSKSYSDNIDQSIKEILFDKNLQENLIKNGHKHVNQYLANPGNASKELARILSSF